MTWLMVSYVRLRCLRSLLCQGLSESALYSQLKYILMKIVGINIFSAQFIKIISHNKNIGHKIYVWRQTACSLVNSITIMGLCVCLCLLCITKCHSSFAIILIRK